MANFIKAAGGDDSTPAPKSTRMNMFQQMKDMDLDNDAKQEPDADADDVNKPGSKKYLERRQKDSERDLRNAPRSNDD